MSIEKLDFQFVTKDHLPFTTFLNKVLQGIKNAEALGLWAYLSSLPPEWKINKTHIQSHFGFGEKKTKFLFSYLAKSNLLEYRQHRDGAGTFQGSSIHILSGKNFITIDDQFTAGAEKEDTGGAEIAPAVRSVDNFPENVVKSMLQPEGQKTGRPVNGAYRKDGHINTTMLIKENNNKKESVSLFPEKQNQKPEYIPDWKKNEPRCIVKEWGPGHPSYDRMHAA